MTPSAHTALRTRSRKTPACVTNPDAPADFRIAAPPRPQQRVPVSILVFNAGSSSLKFGRFHAAAEAPRLSGQFDWAHGYRRVVTPRRFPGSPRRTNSSLALNQHGAIPPQKFPSDGDAHEKAKFGVVARPNPEDAQIGLTPEHAERLADVSRE